MVTVAIFVFMTALILARYSSFSGQIEVKNLAYDIALVIRSAQSYGVGVKYLESAPDSFNAAYGVEIVATPTTSNQKIILYGDKDLDGYDSSEDIAISTYTLRKGSYVSSICLTTGAACAANGADEKEGVDIQFKRPELEATMCRTVANPSRCSYKFAQITISSGDDKNSAMIRVSGNGQITIE
jgi:Tfp pilus assembly protein FimT